MSGQLGMQSPFWGLDPFFPPLLSDHSWNVEKQMIKQLSEDVLKLWWCEHHGEQSTDYTAVDLFDVQKPKKTSIQNSSDFCFFFLSCEFSGKFESTTKEQLPKVPGYFNFPSAKMLGPTCDPYLNSVTCKFKVRYARKPHSSPKVPYKKASLPHYIPFFLRFLTQPKGRNKNINIFPLTKDVIQTV